MVYFHPAPVHSASRAEPWVAAALYRGPSGWARMIGHKCGVLLGLAFALTVLRAAMVAPN
jgi:hypothetical protein